jgi:hypothetical protein
VPTVLKILEPQPAGTLRACTGIALPFLFIKSFCPTVYGLSSDDGLFVGGKDCPVLLLRVKGSKGDVGVARERGI